MENKTYYSVIPAEVKYNKNISSTSKLIFGEISSLSNEKGYCCATNKHLADLYGLSVSSINKVIKELEDNNLIRRELIYGENKEVIERRITVIWYTKRNPYVQKPYVQKPYIGK